MKNIRKPILFAITFVIAGLLISSTVTIPARIREKSSNMSVTKVDKVSQKLSMETTGVKTFNTIPQTLGEPAFEGIGDQLHPGNLV